MLVGAAFELAVVVARLARDERRAVGQLHIHHQSAHGLARQRAFADVSRQPAFVLHHQRDLPRGVADFFRTGMHEHQPG